MQNTELKQEKTIRNKKTPSAHASQLTHRSMVGRTCLSHAPTLPPLAPVRPRPSASSGARSAGLLVAPRPTLGGLKYPANPKRTKAEYTGKVRSRVSVRLRSPLRCSPLRKEPSRHALAHYRPLARLEAAPFSAPLLSASKGAAPPRASLFILPSSSARARGTPYPPRALPSSLGSRLLHHYACI